jgi:aldose 1-epimerase
LNSADTPIVEISCGASLCRIAPEIGGSIAAWEVDGQPMLRNAVSDGGVLGSASFPLVPYSNRIGFGRFDWNGREIGLPAHAVAPPHAIHGVGWEEGWELVTRSSDSVTLQLEFAGDTRWPWPFRAVQKVDVGPGSLTLSLTATNLAKEPAPLAFGHHPYFDAAGAQLMFVAERFYPTAEHDLPAEAVPTAGNKDFSSLRSVGGGLIDNLYGNWRGAARIIWAGRPYALEIRSTLPHAVLYTPPGEDFFCFEPVPHITNALNRADCDMPVIAPGESFTASIHLHAVVAE